LLSGRDRPFPAVHRVDGVRNSMPKLPRCRSKIFGQPQSSGHLDRDVCGLLTSSCVAAIALDSYHATVRAASRLPRVFGPSLNKTSRAISCCTIFHCKPVADSVEDTERMALPPRLRQIAICSLSRPHARAPCRAR